MRSLVGVALRAPKLLAALLGLSLLLSITSLASPATADPAPNLSVSVVDANGDDIVGATVTVSGVPGGGTVTSADTGLDGVDFALASGSYHLSASAGGFVGATYGDDGVVTTIVVVGDTVVVDGETVDNTTVTMTLASNPDHLVNGQVRGLGNVPLTGITVRAVPEDGPTVTTQSTLAGDFTLPLRIETYTVTFLGSVRGNLTYIDTAYAGGVVKVTQAVTPTLATQTVAIDDGSTKFDLKGTVSDGDANPLTGVAVSVLPAGGGAAVATDSSRTIGTEEGAYQVGVRPGKYWLRFEKAGYQPAYLENGETEGPVTVTVSPTGSVSAPEVELDLNGLLPDVTLLLPPAAVVKAPKLTGAAVVGQTLTLSPGSWQGIDVDTDYVTVDWFLDGKAADDYSAGAWYQKFDVPLAAVGKKVGFKITVDDPEGTHAPSVYEGSSAVVPKAAARLKGAFKKGKLAVVLTVPGLPKPSGSIVVKDGKKTVATIKLKAKSKGKAVVKLTKLKRGKHKLTLVYAGSKSVNTAKATVKAKV
jgi:hypothetical protein